MRQPKIEATRMRTPGRAEPLVMAVWVDWNIVRAAEWQETWTSHGRWVLLTTNHAGHVIDRVLLVEDHDTGDEQT